MIPFPLLFGRPWIIHPRRFPPFALKVGLLCVLSCIF